MQALSINKSPSPLRDCVAIGETVKNVMPNLVLNLIQYCFGI